MGHGHRGNVQIARYSSIFLGICCLDLLQKALFGGLCLVEAVNRGLNF
jgi:hypothetical protein